MLLDDPLGQQRPDLVAGDAQVMRAREVRVERGRIVVVLVEDERVGVALGAQRDERPAAWLGLRRGRVPAQQRRDFVTFAWQGLVADDKRDLGRCSRSSAQAGVAGGGGHAGADARGLVTHQGRLHRVDHRHVVLYLYRRPPDSASRAARLAKVKE